jgi:endonuclease YncB( thermonuclease family)
MRLILALLLSTTVPAMTADITGVPRIVDGDTVQIDATKIRLSGIDAPEAHQFCVDPAEEQWECGITARDELVEHAGAKPWTCHVSGLDRYGRSLAACEATAKTSNNGWCDPAGRCRSSGTAIPMMPMRRPHGMRAMAWAGAFIAPWD